MGVTVTCRSGQRSLDDVSAFVEAAVNTHAVMHLTLIGCEANQVMSGVHDWGTL